MKHTKDTKWILRFAQNDSFGGLVYSVYFVAYPDHFFPAAAMTSSMPPFM